MQRAYNPEEPWARQPFDDDLSFVLFQQYLMDYRRPRRLDRVKSRLTLASLKDVAARGYWAERAGCWDDHIARISSATIERCTREDAEHVAERQLLSTKLAQRLGSKVLEKLEAMEDENDFPSGQVTARDALRLIFVGIKTERLIRGEATERVEGPDLSKLSLDELRTLRGLQSKVGQ